MKGAEINELSKRDAADFLDYKAIIANGAKDFLSVGAALQAIREKKEGATFVAVGIALRAVRQRKLYRAEFKNFDAFVRHFFEHGRSWADRQITFIRTIENLTPVGVKTPKALPPPTPANERQARALAGLPVEVQGEILEAADGDAAMIEIMSQDYRLAEKNARAQAEAKAEQAAAAPTKPKPDKWRARVVQLLEKLEPIGKIIDWLDDGAHHCEEIRHAFADLVAAAERLQ